MSRTVSALLQTQLANSATQLSQLWEITRLDGLVIRVTDSDLPVSAIGEEWLPGLGAEGKNQEDLASLSVSNSELEGLLGTDIISDEDLRLGKLDNAGVRIWVVDRDTLETIQLFSGNFGQIELRRGKFTATLRGISDRLRLQIIDLYSPTCRASLGDSDCGVLLEPPQVLRLTTYKLDDIVRQEVVVFPDTRKYGDLRFRCITEGTTAPFSPVYPTMVSQTVVDGGAEFIAEAALMRTSEISSVIDARTFRSTKVLGLADTYFNLGVLTFESGFNEGLSGFVKKFNAELTFKEWTLYQKLPFTIQVGDLFRVSAGCDKLSLTCTQKFDNILRFRGEPFLPGTDWLLRYPNS